MRGARPSASLDARVRAAAPFVPGARVVAAVSGGPDSAAMAIVLDRFARERDVELTLAHVNHGVRPSAEQDECVVLSLGARLGRPVRVAYLRGAGPGEASLRRARYDALARIAAAVGASSVATAHTAEDQSETVLLALLRGTGRRGIAGIPVSRELAPGIALVRPLLDATHAELRAELHRSGLPYARDPTNRDLGRSRNAVRRALGELRATFPQLDRAVARCARIVGEEGLGTERARRRRLVRAILERAGETRDISFERIEAAAALASSRQPRRIHVRPGVELSIGEHLESARVLRRGD